MLLKRNARDGFTIIELLVVIVVIGILAALVIVAFNGVTGRARAAVVQADLNNAAKALETYKIGESDDESYPEDNDCSETPAADTICLPASEGTTYQYTYDAGSNTYALTATNDTMAYYITSTDQVPKEGAWSGHEAPGGDDVAVDGWWTVSASESQTCGIYNGAAYCWGSNSTHGSLGNNSTVNSATPVPVSTAGVLAGKTLTSIAVGGSYACALSSTNEIYCWGYNSVGQLGNNHVGDTGGGSFPYARIPVAVDMSGALAGKTVTAITAQGSTTCAIADGLNYCWGENGWSQRGASGGDIAVPAAVSTSGALGGKTFGTIMGSGFDHTCAVDIAGLVYCWGYNYFGQIGNNANGTTSTPSAVVASGVLNGRTVTAVAGGEVHTCAIADGAAFCWGRELDGRLGNGGDTNFKRSTPLAVTTSGALSGKTLTAISGNGNGTCAVADGKVYCWGKNDYGEGGNGTSDVLLYPTAVDDTGVLNGKTIVSLGAGRFHTCAIDDAGKLYCWGRNTVGQLGDGTTSNSLVPVQVSDPS